MKNVVIVGAGIVGLFCAVQLRRAGAQVMVIEAAGEFPSPFGPTASAAAAGMLAPLSSEASPHEALALESYELWRSLQRGAEWEDGVRFDGGVILSRTAADADAFRRNAEQLGRSVSALSSGQFRKRTGMRAKPEHALFVEDEGVADPMRVLSGLAMQARALGVRFDYGGDAEDASPTTVTVQDAGVYECDAVILAPGVWATRRLAEAAPALKHVRSAKGHLAAVRLGEPLAPNVRGPDFYLTQRREDVVLGATLEMDRFDRKIDAAKVAELHAAAEAMLPGQVKLSDSVWTGLRPMSPDGWPMIGPSNGIFVAAGHSRNGWLLAPITAEIITAYVFGAEIKPAWAALSPDRFGSP